MGLFTKINALSPAYFLSGLGIEVIERYYGN
jgi:hypothetical protein